MVSYIAGNWTKSALDALKFIADENSAGRHPRLKDIKSGTFRNWTSVYKKEGYLVDDNGFSLNEKGTELLNSLLENPPQDRRGKIRKHAPQLSDYMIASEQVTTDKTHTEKEKRKTRKSVDKKKEPKVKKGYRVSVSGQDLSFEMLVTREEAIQSVNLLSDIQRK